MNMQRFPHLLRLQFLCGFMLANFGLSVQSQFTAARPDKYTALARAENAFYEARAFVTGKTISTKTYDPCLCAVTRFEPSM